MTCLVSMVAISPGPVPHCYELGMDSVQSRAEIEHGNGDDSEKHEGFVHGLNSNTHFTLRETEQVFA